MNDALEAERAHEDAWYGRVVTERFFEREGFKRLRAANLAAFRRAVPIGPDTRLLSIGCGSGEYEVQLAAQAAEVVGLDLSPVAIAAARDRAAAAGAARARFEVAAIGEADLPAGHFDVVMALGVLHHLGDAGRRDALGLARHWVAPGGWLYVRDPNARGLLRRLAGPFARRDEFHSPNEAALDPAVLRREVENAGFSDVHVDYTDVVAGPLPWLVGARSPWLWRAVATVDRAWLAVPGLRALASQFAIVARG